VAVSGRRFGFDLSSCSNWVCFDASVSPSEVDDGNWQRAFIVQAVVPHSGDGASIILNGSVPAVLGNPGYSAYAASKGAIPVKGKNRPFVPAGITE
jgi:hypothetical protein